MREDRALLHRLLHHEPSQTTLAVNYQGLWLAELLENGFPRAPGVDSSTLFEIRQCRPDRAVEPTACSRHHFGGGRKVTSRDRLGELHRSSECHVTPEVEQFIDAAVG